MGHFLPFPSLKTTKIIILKKWKNLLKILSFYKCVPKTSIIWGTVLKIQSETQNFLSFWAIFTLLHSYQSRKSKFWKNKKSIWRCCHFLYTCILKITITWCMLPEIWSVRDIIFCHFGPFFCPLTPLPPNNLENQNFEKLKKKLGDIIILHKCSKNHDHIYSSWDMVRNRLVIFHFGLFFALRRSNYCFKFTSQ